LVRGKDAHPLAFWIGIVLLIVLLAVLAGGSVALRGESASTPTPSPPRRSRRRRRVHFSRIPAGSSPCRAAPRPRSFARVWTLDSYSDHREFGAASGERITFARWKPGADELVVLVADRLEIWPNAGGDRPIVARRLPAASDPFVSSDGALAFVGFGGGASAISRKTRQQVVFSNGSQTRQVERSTTRRVR